MRTHTLAIGVLTAASLAAMPAAALAAGSYTSGQTGYDISYNISAGSYPVGPFAFGIVGVSHGKAFTHNSDLASEFAWAQGHDVAPALYMNLNTPVGRTAKANTAGPVNCGHGKSAQLCQAHNYGWNAAADAYTWAQSQGATSDTWWLDIETANSWSGNLAVNEATIQGAIDYLSQSALNITNVGVYSTPGMWSAIVGGWAPGIPEWLAVGNMSQTDAAAHCLDASFTGGGIWLVQFIDSTVSSLDQDYAC